MCPPPGANRVKFFMFQYLLSITSLRIYVMVTLILILIMVIWSSGDDVGDVVGVGG